MHRDSQSQTRSVVAHVQSYDFCLFRALPLNPICFHSIAQFPASFHDPPIFHHSYHYFVHLILLLSCPLSLCYAPLLAQFPFYLISLSCLPALISRTTLFSVLHSAYKYSCQFNFVEVHTVFWCGNLRERDHLADLGVDRRIILKRNFKKWDGTWTGLIWLRTEQVVGSCEWVNEHSDSTKHGEFLD